MPPSWSTYYFASDVIGVTRFTSASGVVTSQLTSESTTRYSNESSSADGGFSSDWVTGYNVSRPNEITDSSSFHASNTTGGSSSYSTVEMTVLGLAAGLTSLITIAGNLVVILSFVLERSIRQPTNYFIASLAVSDLLIGSVSMPLYTVYLLAGQYWPLGEKICDLWLSVDYTSCLCSIYTVFCITVDRFCSVTVPAKYRNWRTERKVLTIVCVTWIVPVGVFFTSIFGWQYFVGHRSVEPGKCHVQYMESAIFNAVLQVGYFWITLVVMCCLYTGIYRVALRLQRKSDQKHRKTTTLVSVAGEAMTRIGIGMSKQQQQHPTEEDEKPEGNATLRTSKAVEEDAINGRRQTRVGKLLIAAKEAQQQEEELEDSSSSPAFSSDSVQHNFHGGFNGEAEARFNRRPPEAIPPTTKDGFRRQLPPNSAQTENRIGSAAVAMETPTDDDDDARSFGSMATAADPVHRDLLPQFGDRTQRICSEQDEPITTDGGQGQGQEKVVDEQQNNAETNSTHSTDVVWLLRTVSSSRFNDDDDDDDAGDVTRDSSMTSSPVWIRRSHVVDSSVVQLKDLSIESLKKKNIVDASTSISSSRPEKSKNKKVSEASRNHGIGPPPLPPPPSRSCGCNFPPTGKDTAGCDNTAMTTGTTNSEGSEERGKRKRTRGGKGGGGHGRNDARKRRRPKTFGSVDWFLSFRRRVVSRSGSTASSAERPAPPPAKPKTSKSEDRAMKALRAITVILGAFVLCWTPWHVLSMIIGFCSECVNPVLYDVSYWLCYLNSPINPFCYAFANLQFKRTFVRIFRLDWHRT